MNIEKVLRGETWTNLVSSDLKSPCSPASIKKVPLTGDLLCIYNDYSERFPYHIGKRTPLVSAISKGEGKTWENHKIIEDDPIGGANALQVSRISIN